MRDFQSYFRTAVVWIAAIGLVFGSAATAAAQQITNFKVDVSLTDRDGNAATGLNVVFQNTSAEGAAAAPQSLSEDASNPGSYSVTLTDLDLGIFKQVLIPKAGDVVSIRATQTVDGVETPWSSLQRTITQAELDAGETAIDMTESGLTVEFEEADVRGDGVSTATLVVTVMDASGNLVDDADLTAAATVGSLGDFTSVGSGKHESVFAAPLTSQDVTATVTVTYGSDSGKATITITGVPATVAVSVDPAEVVADGASTAVVTATVTRDDEAVVNETVTIRATLGTVGDVTNNGDGTYTATITAGTTAGTAAITVTASSGDTGSGSLTLTPGAPASIVASVDPTEIRGDSITTATFTATIADANGNGVSGLENVTAALTGGGSLGAVTDGGDGTYNAVYTSPLVREDAVASVEFTYAALTPASATLSVTGEPEAETTLLVVRGLATYLDRTHAAPNGLSVMVENVTRGTVATSATGDDGAGRYTATFLNPADPNAAVAGSNDLVRVTVTDPVSNQATVVERRLTAEEVNAGVVDVDVETNLKATASSFIVKGLVQYSDGTAAVLPSERLTAEVTIGEASQQAALNNAATPGMFEINFAGAAFEVATGDLIYITVYDQDGSVVVTGDRFTFTASSAQVIGGEIDLGAILTTRNATAENLQVRGVVQYSDGAAPVSPGLGLTAYVTVGEYSENLMLNDPTEHGVFAVTFLNLPGITPFMAQTGDMVSVEVRDNGTVVAMDSRLVTSQEIIDGAFIFEPIRTSLPATSDLFYMIVSGMVSADTGIDDAPDGSTVRVTNLTRGPGSPNPTSLVSAGNAITNGSYTATLRSSDVGGYRSGDVANTGDILLVEAVSPDGVVLAAKEFTLDSQSVLDDFLEDADVVLTGVVLDLSIGGEVVGAGTRYETPYDPDGVASATVVAAVSGFEGELTFGSGGVGSFAPLDGNTRTFSTVYDEEMYFTSESGLVTITVSAGDKATRTVTLDVVDIDDPVINSITPEGPLALIGEEETLTADVEDNTEVESIVWTFPDGTTQSGMTATKSFDEVARYSVTLTVTDVAGNEVTRTKTIDVLDLQFSTASDQVEYDENGVATVAVTIEAEGPSGTIDFGESEFTLTLTDGVSAETSDFTKTYMSDADLGDHTLTATVTNEDGQTVTQSVTVELVDLIAPAATLTSVPAKPLREVGDSVDLSVAVVENTEIASIEWQADGVSLESRAPTEEEAASGVFAYTYMQEGDDPAPALVNITFHVTDTSDNTNDADTAISVPITFVDVEFSAEALEAPYDENGVASTGMTIVVTGPDGEVTPESAGLTMALTPEELFPDLQTFSKTYETAEDLGDHEVTLTITSEADETIVKTLTLNLVDQIAPAATLTSVAEPLELVGQPVDVSVEVVENTEIASIEWKADGVSLESRAPTEEEAASGVFAYTYTQEGDDPAPALVNVTFHVADTSDNTNDADTPITVPITFVDVEFSADSLEVPYDADGVASTGMTIVVTGPDGEVTPESAGLSFAVDPAELFSEDLATFSKTYASVNDLGEHEVTLTITSEAGEEIVRTLTLTLVDHIYPMVTLTSTAEPLKEAGQSVMVSVDVVENTEIRGIEWRVDGVAVEIRKPEAGETAFSYTYTQDDPAAAAVEVSFHVADTSRNRNDDSESADATPINVPITFVVITFSAPDLGDDMEVAYDENGVAAASILEGVLGPDGDLPKGGDGLSYELAPAELFTEAYDFEKMYASVDDLGPHEVTLTVTHPAGEMIVRTMTLNLVDRTLPMVSEIAADSTNSAGMPFILVNRDLTLSATASDNTEILTVEWIFPDKTIEGALDADGATSVTRIFEEPGDFMATLRVVDSDGNENSSMTMIKVRRVEVGGLALDLRGASEIIVALLQSPMVSDLLAANGLPTITQLLGDNPSTEDVLQLLNSPQIMAALQQAGLTLPGLPALLNPVIIPNEEDLYLENFGNALSVPHLEVWDNLSGVADGSYRIENGMTLTGHKLSLFAVAPKAMEVVVTLHGSDGMTYSEAGVSAEGTGAFQHEFAVDEDLFLGTLPAWPASDSSPIQEVTLRLSTNGIDGPYVSVPLSKQMRTVGGYAEPVWSATETLNAGGTYYYYYVVEMTHQIPVGGGKRTAKMMVIPDPRNLQMAPTIDIGSLTIADIQAVANTGRVPLVSKFSVPEADGLWTLDFDVSQIPDGNYQISVMVDGEPGFDGGTRPLSINRAPEPVSDVTVEAVNGATHYIDENGAVVSTNANGEGALALTAEAMDGGADIYDRTSVIFQIRPVTGEPTVDFWTTINIPTSVTPLMDGLANDEFLPLIAYVNQITGGLIGRIGPEPVRTEVMEFPQVGTYLIRAISIDQFSNLNMSNPQAVEIVPRTVGEFNVSSLGIGNLKGNEAERYISADVPKDGSVAADDFRIWSDTTELEVTIRSLRDVSIPLTSAALQSSIDGGATWTDLKVYDEAALAAVDSSWMSDMTSHMIDGVQLATDGVMEYRLRVAAENRLMISGVGPETVLVVDVLPIPVAPEVLAFASAQAEGTSVSPDSGGARDQLVLTVETPFNMLPKAPSVVIEISADGGQTFMPLAAEMGGPEAGTISGDDHTKAGGMPEIGVNRTAWTAVWDTTMAADTVENMEPEARDASMDDNPYIVRASLMGEGGTAYLSETLTIPVDNVDDVPPLSSTVVTLVEREAKTPGTFEAVDANEDGSYTVRSDVRITASVTAGYLTIEGGDVALVVVDESGAVMQTLGDAAPVAEGQESYSFTFDSTMFPNGALRLAVLATDASGNQELAVIDTTVVANIANILIGGLLPDDPGVYELIRITQTGVLMTDRTFATDQADRPIGGMALFELDTENAMTAEAYISANMADLTDEALVDATPMVAVGENGAFQLPLDVSGLADGEYYVRIVLAASPNVFAPLAPVAFTVDNTAPPLTIEAPATGTAVNTRPTIVSEGYEDPTGIVTVGLTLSGNGAEVFTGFAGGNADMRLAGNEDLVNADGMTTDGLVFAAPQISYITPSHVRHASGSYVATGTATDYAGNVATVSVVYVIEQDATAPTVTAYSPTGVIATRTPTVSVSFTEDNSGVTADGVSIQVSDSAGNAVAGTTTLLTIPLHLGEDSTADDILDALNSPDVMDELQQGDGPQLSGVVSFIADEDLANGAYSVTASVADAENNVSPVSWEFTVYVDDNPPVITEFSPSGTIETADTTLSATFYDELEVTSVTFTVDDGEPIDADEIVGNTSATLAVTGLADGGHTVVVTATDALGNVGSGQFTFTVSLDLEPPVITAFSPTGIVESSDATLAATFSDASEVVSVTFAVDGGDAVDADAIADNTSATLAVTGLADGDHTVVVTATDEHGNVGSAEYQFTVSLDLEAPVITTVSPTGVVEMPDTTLAVSFSDESEVTSVTFAVDGGDAMDAAISDDNTSATLAATGLSDGDHTVVVMAMDEHGNVGSAEYQFTVSLDLEAPVITTVSPTGVVEMPDTTLAVSFSDESEVTSVTFAVDGGDAVDAAIADDNTSATLAVTGLADGDHTVVVTATDEHGNVGSAEYQFTVSLDLEAPVITTVSPTGVVEMPDTTLAAAFSDASMVTSATFSVDGGDAMDAAIAEDNTSATLAVTGLADGDHMVMVTVTDEHGNVGSAEYQFTVSLDLEAPVITTVSPTGVVEMPDTTLAATFSDASAVVSVTFAVDGGDAVDAAAIADNTSATLAVTGLSDGDHTVVVTATDEHGNVGSAEYQFTVSLDLEAPVITTVSPTGVVEMPDTTLAAAFSDASAVVSVTFAVDGGDAVDAAIADDNTSATLAVTGLSDGDHTVVVTATDEHGNVGSAEYQFTVSLDLEAPVITTVSPTGVVEMPDTTLAATFSDASAVVSVTFAVDGGDAVDAAAIADNTSATLAATGLSDGDHTVVVTATDEHGNVGSAEYQFTVSLDLEAPVITTVSPTGTVESADTTLTATFSDASEVTSVTFSVDGGAAQDAASIADNTMARLPVTGLSDGEHTVVVKATDEHGNVGSAEYLFTVSLDTAAPIITSTSPIGIVRTADTTLAVNFFDDSEVDSVTFSVDGGAAQDAADIVDNSRAHLPVDGLSQGSHTVVVTATDEHGNKASAQYSFLVEIDMIPPTIATMSPTGYVRSLRPLISATFTDNLAGVDADSVELTVNGNAVNADATDSSVSYQPSADLPTGTHEVTLTLADALGNEASTSWTFTIETTPPSIWPAAPVDGARVGKNVAARTDVVVSAYYADADSGIDVDSVELTVTRNGNRIAGTIESKTESGVAWKAQNVLRAGIYTVTVSVADNLGNATEHSWSFIVEEEEAITIPVRVVPNPFEKDVAVWVGLGKEAEVRVRIYDLNGRLVAERPGQILLPGRHAINLTEEICNYGRGVYICQVIVDAADRERVVKIVKMAKIR